MEEKSFSYQGTTFFICLTSKVMLHLDQSDFVFHFFFLIGVHEYPQPLPSVSDWLNPCFRVILAHHRGQVKHTWKSGVIGKPIEVLSEI